MLTSNVSKEIIRENALKLNSLINESYKKKSFFNHYVNNNFDEPSYSRSNLKTRLI